MPPPLADQPSASDNTEARLRLLIDAAPVAMIVVDQKGQIVFANRQVAKTFGYEARELLGRDVELLIPESARKSHRSLMETFFDSGVARVMGVGREVHAVDRRGREFPVEIGLTPIENAARPQVMAAIIDITERKRIERESTLARIVQTAMLPQSSPEFDGCDIAGASEPADATGGDFFDYICLSGDRLGVVIGDASGHGFAAALITAAARSYLRAFSSIEYDLSRTLATTNRLLIEDVSEGRFVTLFYAMIDPKRATITYAGAGHAGYLIGRSGSLKKRLESTGPPLGWFPEAEYPSVPVSIEGGDILVLLTDGIEEALSAASETFGRDRVIGIVKEHSAQPASNIVRAVLDGVRRFRAECQQSDDVTAIVVKFALAQSS